MIITILDANVTAGREADLQMAFRAAEQAPRPAGLLNRRLLRDRRDQTRWQIATLWERADALNAMRSAGTPAGVLIFRAAGAEPTLSVWDVAHELRG